MRKNEGKPTKSYQTFLKFTGHKLGIKNRYPKVVAVGNIPEARANPSGDYW